MIPRVLSARSRFDPIVLGSALALSVLGVFFVASATAGGPLARLAARQGIWVAVGVGLMLAAVLVDYRVLLKISLPIYCVCLVPLVYLLFFGERIANVKSWIRIAGFQFQPAELAKIATALLVAYLFDNEDDGRLRPGAVVKLVAIVGVPFLLVFLQPDMGLAATFLPLLAVGLYFGGLPARFWLVLFLIVVLLSGSAWFLLKDYQKDRIGTFLNPEQDLLGSGYQVRQSKIAVGSGGFFGKGFRSGTQSQLRFLPVQHTDFILAVIAEELGFLGVILVLGLFAALLLRALTLAQAARDRGGVFLILALAGTAGKRRACPAWPGAARDGGGPRPGRSECEDCVQLDAVLLVSLLALWVACTALHVKQVAGGQLAWVSVYVAAPAGGDGFPTVRGFWPGATRAAYGALAVGDRLLSVGGADLRGVGPFGFVARTYAAAAERRDLRVPLTYERRGLRRQDDDRISFPSPSRGACCRSPARWSSPARWCWRGGRARASRAAFFLLAIAYGLHWTFFFGGPRLQTYAWVVVFFCASLVMLPLILRAVLIFPAEVAPAGGRLPWWPWLFAVFGPISLSWIYRGSAAAGDGLSRRLHRQRRRSSRPCSPCSPATSAAPARSAGASSSGWSSACTSAPCRSC